MKPTLAEKHPPRSNKNEWFIASHFYIWIGAGAIFYLSDELDRLFNLWLLVVPLVGIPMLVAIGTFLWGLTTDLWARRWKRLLSVIAAPLIVVGLLAAARQHQINPDWFRFQLNRSRYAELARELPGPSPKYGQWNWGGTGGAATANSFYTLVYDETDHPIDHMKQRGHTGADLYARPYGHHFFLITELYQ